MINEKKVSPKEKSCLLCKRFDKKYIIGFAAAILLTVVAGALYTRLKMSPKDMSVTTEGSGTFTVNW
ncbi:MAG: hypothetical protein ABIE03_02545, partial [Patescibacteria group bacterium]|nr:hypothetical protein [Patescibacteria group bacterium]